MIVAEPTLQDIFGAGATQTATTITILKSNLAMAATATNRGDQIFAAVMKRAAENLTAASFTADPDRSINVTTGFDSLIYRNVSNVQTPFLQNQLTINFLKLQTSAGITPDDY